MPGLIAGILLFSWYFIVQYAFPWMSIWSNYIYLIVFSLGAINGITIIWYRRAIVIIRGIPAIIFGVIMFGSCGYIVFYMVQQLIKP
jgi:hypothetical protein